MPIDFPTSVTTGQIYNYQGKSWVWNGVSWDARSFDDTTGNVTVFANAAARSAAIPTPSEGLVSYLNDTNLLETYSGSAWIPVGNTGTPSYNFVQTLYFTSSGTFAKATYPWLRAIRVKVQGAGGGSGGCVATGSGAVSGSASGGGGAYAESFITDIAGLASSITVTRGAGGAGGAAGDNAGSTGGTSSFGSLVSANGGFGGGGSGAFAYAVFNGSSGGVAATGDFIVIGGSSGFSESTPTLVRVGGSGGSYLGNAVSPWVSFNALGSITGNLYGGGAGGAANTQNQGAARPGASGGNGIVIVELYA